MLLTRVFIKNILTNHKNKPSIAYKRITYRFISNTKPKNSICAITSFNVGSLFLITAVNTLLNARLKSDCRTGKKRHYTNGL